MRLCFIFIYGLSNKLRASVAHKKGDGQHVPGTHSLPIPPASPPSCPKMELTFLKLNESAVSGKWISNICLEKHITKSKKKNENGTENSGKGGKTNCRDKIKIC